VEWRSDCSLGCPRIGCGHLCVGRLASANQPYTIEGCLNLAGTNNYGTIAGWGATDGPKVGAAVISGGGCCCGDDRPQEPLADGANAHPLDHSSNELLVYQASSHGVPGDSDLGRILARRARTTNDMEAIYRHLQDYHGLDPNVARERLHRIKDTAENNPDVVLTWNGGVYDATSGDHLGELIEG
jgi:hypothetical protein